MADMERMLILNPGSTSTKIAVYEDERQIFVENILHDSERMDGYKRVIDQFEFRRDLVLESMASRGVAIGDLSAVISRGGLLPPIRSGAYEINDDMVWQLRYAPRQEHASNLGAIIARSIAELSGGSLKAYIYDGVTVDEMIPIVQITGMAHMRRMGIGHNLNMRAACVRYAEERGKRYDQCSLLVIHLGGGFSTGIHHLGRIIDIVCDEEGAFSPDRAGGLPNYQLLEMAYSEGRDFASMMRILKNAGGLKSHFGVNDAVAVERMAKEGDARALLVYEAMALNVSKNIGALATVLRGKAEAIILTGGMAYSEYFIGMIRERVEFIAPVVVYPGENEMLSLALGGLRVLRGEEEARTYRKDETALL
jgi:butyrate kinase